MLAHRSDRLTAMGRWMRLNNRSVNGCTAVPDGFKTPEGTELTYGVITLPVVPPTVEVPVVELVLK